MVWICWSLSAFFSLFILFVFFFNDTATTEIYTLSLHDALPILQVEQKLQKEQKKQRAALYEVVRAYGGSLFPLTHGLCVCCCFPLSDEPRINIQPGDVISVTRWRKYVLFYHFPVPSLTYTH